MVWNDKHASKHALRSPSNEGIWRRRLCYAQVFTTCSMEAKRCALLARFPGLSSEHIADSRSCAFEAAVLSGTGGRGVDLVLNSLAGDKLQARSSTLSDAADPMRRL